MSCCIYDYREKEKNTPFLQKYLSRIPADTPRPCCRTCATHRTTVATQCISYPHLQQSPHLLDGQPCALRHLLDREPHLQERPRIFNMCVV